jgi:lactoylglutathione lyase
LDVTYPPSFHIGFIQATEREVDAINRRLRKDGFEVAPPARLHGAWTFYFTAPGGFVIEVLG